MAKPKTMYPLQGIFTNLLTDGEKEKFMIPAYQRGYKWTSAGENSQVEVLVKDLFHAFELKSPRYYLQFITLKENRDAYEVIDGQQRLTTLTILFAIFADFTKPDEGNFVNGKLYYQVRANFVKKFIYDNIAAVLSAADWDCFLGDHALERTYSDNQDAFFIFHAAKAIQGLLKAIAGAGKIEQFYGYVCDKVYLIVNVLDPEMSSEKIFINVNKGVKLKDEDLVKGLLITKIPLDRDEGNYRTTENEINEIRSNMGRQWDELARWASREDIRHFFNIDQEENYLAWLIDLAYPDARETSDQYPLFSYIDDLYRVKGEQASAIFKNIRTAMLTLHDWYSEPELCNLLGYLLHAKRSLGLSAIWLILRDCRTKAAVLEILKNKCKELLPADSGTQKLLDLNYDDHKTELFNLFLMLDVAKSLPMAGRKANRYDFSKIMGGSWSIEHIFPQNAKDFKGLEKLTKEDLLIIKELLPSDIKDINPQLENNAEAMRLYEKIRKAGTECIILKDERESLADLLKKNAPDLHKVGNFALLQQSMNASLSNRYFDGKRMLMAEKVSRGAFVPFHTYDVFSKLIINTPTSLHIWSNNDIASHENYITGQMEGIMQYLSI